MTTQTAMARRLVTMDLRAGMFLTSLSMAVLVSDGKALPFARPIPGVYPPLSNAPRQNNHTPFLTRADFENDNGLHVGRGGGSNVAE